MKKTIELLKNKGIIDRLQDTFNRIKPTKGTSEKTILATVEHVVDIECEADEDFKDELFEAIFDDAIQNIRNELKVEFVEPEDFIPNALTGMLSILLGHSNIHIHVVGADEEKKGQGDE